MVIKKIFIAYLFTTAINRACVYQEALAMVTLGNVNRIRDAK